MTRNTLHKMASGGIRIISAEVFTATRWTEPGVSHISKKCSATRPNSRSPIAKPGKSLAIRFSWTSRGARSNTCYAN